MYFTKDHNTIYIKGAGASDLLQGQITRDVGEITPNAYLLSTICDNKGRVISLFWIKKLEEGFELVMLSEVSIHFINHLNKYAQFFKADISEKPLTPDANVKTRDDWQEYLLSNGIVEVSAKSVGKFTPHELNYHNLQIIDFQKGCYNGQEVVARMHYRGKLKFGIKKIMLSDNFLPLNSDITDQNGKKIGETLLLSEKKALVLLKNKENIKKELFYKAKKLDFQVLE